MNEVPIGQRIDRQYAALSRQEQRAADVVLDRLDDLAVYSASEIAQLSGVSKATVSRLVRRLGYQDFAQVRAQAKLLRGLGSPMGAAAPAEPGGDALAAHLAAERRNLDQLAHAVADGRLDAAARLLAEASQIVVIGRRNSYPVALHLRQQLAQIRGRVTVLPVPGQSLGEDLADLGPKDAAVLVGFRRRPNGFSALVEALLARDVPVVLIGDASLEPWRDRVAHFLPAPLDSPSAFDSYAAAMSLVNLLATAILARHTRQGRTRVSTITTWYDDLHELEEAR
ncbi:MAG TPA: MurR/RpiR family transcriptional regulator [Actinospica sp.]|jgi:DNA-binding MurR/RpiR family transcriptional regulator|nr:MurR/RpiR family transcriptional regulator [Actinospica sp.]